MPVDRTRRFTLPGIDGLNKDQDAALALPLEGQHLVIGGPGTGKSVIALLRARRLAEDEKKYRVLVYNHLLESSNRHLFGIDKAFVSQTWETWFRDLYNYIFKSRIPTLEPDGQSTFRAIDWKSVEHSTKVAKFQSLQGKPFYIVIDEGQDMPPSFYRALVNWGLENFYVVADQNQQIFPDRSSSIQEIENVLGLDRNDTLRLKLNYRNTLPIAILAQHLCPNDPASPKPDLPEPTPGAITPELWAYGSDKNVSFTAIITRILALCDRNPRKLIGIITPNNKVREKYLSELHRANPRLDNGKPPIQTYPNSSRVELNFGQGGIMVINAQSCKGLEFDTAILADIDLHSPKNANILKPRFYVMTTRAKDQVILLRTGVPSAIVEGLLPSDSKILARK